MGLTAAKNRYYDLINNIVNLNKISHAYLIEIDDYDDFSCVLDFVKLILCRKNDNDNICDLIDNGNYPDLKIIEPDGNIIKKGQLLKLQEEFKNKSFLNNKMIYIIKEADKLNDSSANTILKFLEEPEEDIVAILVTTNRYKVIDTILSRCQVLSIQDNNLVHVTSGNVFDLIKMICNRDDLFINYQFIYTDILPDKVIAKNLLSEVEFVFLNYLNCISNGDDISCSSEIVNVLSKLDIEQVMDFIIIIEEEIKKLEYNVNYKLWLDSLFSRFIGG